MQLIIAGGGFEPLHYVWKRGPVGLLAVPPQANAFWFTPPR